MTVVLDEQEEAEILDLADKMFDPTMTQCSSALCHNRTKKDGTPAPFCHRCRTTGAPRIGDDPYA